MEKKGNRLKKRLVPAKTFIFSLGLIIAYWSPQSLQANPIMMNYDYWNQVPNSTHVFLTYGTSDLYYTPVAVVVDGVRLSNPITTGEPSYQGGGSGMMLWYDQFHVCLCDLIPGKHPYKCIDSGGDLAP